VKSYNQSKITQFQEEFWTK